MDVANRFLGCRDFLEVNGRGLITVVQCTGQLMRISLGVIVAVLFCGGHFAVNVCSRGRHYIGKEDKKGPEITERAGREPSAGLLT
jgi:hypothetical protein